MTDLEIWSLRRDCATYGVLCFRDVAGMTADKFGRLMSRFGAITRDYRVEEDGSLDPSAVEEISPMVFGNGGEGEHLYAEPSWHFDGEDMPWLHSYTSLFCLQAPFPGHTTGFTATNRAVDFMPTGMHSTV